MFLKVSKVLGENLCWSLFLKKLQVWRPDETPTHMFFCKIFENFKSTYLEEHLPTTAPECLRKISLLLDLGKPILDGRWHNLATSTLHCKYEPHEDCAIITLYQNAFCYFFQTSEEGKSWTILIA